jgi:hypothetical protein
MPRFVDAEGTPTADEEQAAKDPESGQPMQTPLRQLWVTETALSTALNTAYFAESIATSRSSWASRCRKPAGAEHGQPQPSPWNRRSGRHRRRRRKPRLGQRPVTAVHGGVVLMAAHYNPI